MFSFFKRRKAQKACDAFNAANPIGTRVAILGSSRRWDTRNFSPIEHTSDLARVDANQAVVALAGMSRPYPLDMLCVMPLRTIPAGYADNPHTRAAPTSTSSFADDFSSPGYSPAYVRADNTPAPSIVSGGGGNFGGGGATGSWGDSGSSSYGSSDSGGSSSSDSGSSGSSSD